MPGNQVSRIWNRLFARASFRCQTPRPKRPLRSHIFLKVVIHIHSLLPRKTKGIVPLFIFTPTLNRLEPGGLGWHERWREGTGRGQSVGGRCLSPHGRALAAKLASGTRSPNTSSSLSAPAPLSLPLPPRKLPLRPQALDSDPSPGMTPSPRSLSPSGSRPAAASLWALPPHLHGDAPALHGGEAVGQRQARGADPVPGALHRVGLREVGTHGGGWPAASGARERSATRAGAGAPGVRVAGAGPAARPTQGAGERREAGQEAVTGPEQRESGSGNGAARDPARPARRGAALRAVISLATRPARGDNGPPNRRSRETGAATPTNGRGVSWVAPLAALGLYVSVAVPPFVPRTPASRVFVWSSFVWNPALPVHPPVCQPLLSPPRPQTPQSTSNSVRLKLTSICSERTKYLARPCEACMSRLWQESFLTKENEDLYLGIMLEGFRVRKV